ncbi:hypothetical protein BLNAU_5306 [Blattamonas nauphoetae]|uniref:Uncharacterized protein n=1 Tax=Blattamonas nauphoetae TaxID=2049346 RepID=A0ABQ9Y7S7_9EUKA|nr:hypothetical protein BLNAU_5306 [Blattamonas nauphoetae]
MQMYWLDFTRQERPFTNVRYSFGATSATISVVFTQPHQLLDDVKLYQSIATGITFIVENMGTLPKDEHGGGPVPRIVESPVYTSLLLDIIPRSQYLRTGENYQNPEGPGRFVGRGRSYSSKLESEIGGFSLQTSGGGERWKGRIQKKIFGGKFQSHLSGRGKRLRTRIMVIPVLGRELQRKPDLPLHKKEAAGEARSSTPQEGSCRGSQIFHSTRRKLQRKPDLPLHKKEAAEEARSSTPQEGSCRGSQIFHSTRRELQRKPDLPLHKKGAAEEARSSTPQEGSYEEQQFSALLELLIRQPYSQSLTRTLCKCLLVAEQAAILTRTAPKPGILPCQDHDCWRN